MREHKNKIIGLILCVLLFTAALSGCVSEPRDTDKTETNAETEAPVYETEQIDSDGCPTSSNPAYSPNAPHFMYSRRYPFAISDITYSEDGKTLYIAGSSQIHAVNTFNGETKKIYNSEHSVYKTAEKDGILYLISSDAVEIWDIASDRPINTVSLQKTADDACDCGIVGELFVAVYSDGTVLTVNLKDLTTETKHIAGENNVSEPENITCILDEDHGRVYLNGLGEHVYCYDISADKTNTFPSEKYQTEIYVNEATGMLYILDKDIDNDAVSCKLYSAEYELIKEQSWNANGNILSGFYIADVANDGSAVLIADEMYGRILVADLNSSKNCLWIEDLINGSHRVSLLGTDHIVIRGSSKQPWRLFSIKNRKYSEYSEITGFLNYSEGKDTLTLYKDNGMISVYYTPAEPCVQESEQPGDNISANAEHGMPSTVYDRIVPIATSPDGHYRIEIHIPKDREGEHSFDVDQNTDYRLTDSVGNAFTVKFPRVEHLRAVAVKDNSRAAVIDKLGVYYEFDPRNGEIYHSGTLQLEPDTDLNTVQLTVDFENSLAGVIYRVTNNGFEGALYSTETYKQLFYYGETYSDIEHDDGVGHGYMLSDPECRRIYYREVNTGRHFVLTLPIEQISLK